ncbi:MAG: LysR family transcriptional regulator [Proteobacteria bacterium]|nr:LysR family transcriptional regulator [Pseudomonadota bacterium]
MALRLPPLATLRIFEAAARLQSFKLAASEIGLTPSAVSHGIDTLEKWLEVRLFDRAGRTVTLTEIGRQYLPYVAEGLSMIGVGTERVASGPHRKRVSVSVAPTFAMEWLVPRLARFNALHPDIAVLIDTSHRQALFPLDGVDLAIRMGKGPWPNTNSQLLMRESLVPVASPAYLAGLGGASGLDWAKAKFIHVSSVENDWSSWFSGVGLEAPDGASHLHFDTVHLALDAAAEGLGIAIGRLPLLDKHLHSGRLVRASDRVLPIETGYWLAAPPGDETRREIRAFQRWVLSEISGETRRSQAAE